MGGEGRGAVAGPDEEAGRSTQYGTCGGRASESTRSLRRPASRAWPQARPPLRAQKKGARGRPNACPENAFCQGNVIPANGCRSATAFFTEMV